MPYWSSELKQHKTLTSLFAFNMKPHHKWSKKSTGPFHLAISQEKGKGRASRIQLFCSSKEYKGPPELRSSCQGLPKHNVILSKGELTQRMSHGNQKDTA